jgi:hypothetical protein
MATSDSDTAMLDALVREHLHDVRAIADVRAFREWLRGHLDRWERDPIFQQRSAVREIRRRHPEFRVLERRYRAAVERSEASPEGTALHRVEHECANAQKAIAGIGRAIQRESGEKRMRLGEKLAHYQTRMADLEVERMRLLDACAACRDARIAFDELTALQASSGLERAEATLATLMVERGRGSGRAGEAFEHASLDATHRLIVPHLDEDARALRIVSHVRLGGARVELDHVVVRCDGTVAPVDVLAIVEAKRNINDLAHGYALRVENIAWLSGRARGFDPELYRTRSYPGGVFDRSFTHRDADGDLLFGQSSFARFADEREATNRLYMITRPGPIWGLSSGALARLSYRIAIDERWDPADDAYLARLHEWTLTLANEFETPDLLAMYRRRSDARGRILLI